MPATTEKLECIFVLLAIGNINFLKTTLQEAKVD